jgi:hypothetical protein
MENPEEIEYYPVIDISDQDIDNYEQMGTKSKFWYTDSNTNEEFLFKSIRTEDKNGKKIERKGEDWAEKVACELAELLGVPHAIYDLATYNGERGIRSKKFTKQGENMFFGNQLIEHVVNTLNSTLEQGQRSQTVPRVGLVLEKIIKNPPLGWDETENIKTALDVFIGYLLLDTLISNQDRHNENWGMISLGTQFSLAPSFDHAASLGRNESEATMIERLNTKDEGRRIPTYVSKSKSHFYHGSKKLKTLDAFLLLGYNSKKATLEWFSRLRELSDHTIANIIIKIPINIMSDTEKYFCYSVIIANKARLQIYEGLFLDTDPSEVKD